MELPPVTPPSIVTLVDGVVVRNPVDRRKRDVLEGLLEDHLPAQTGLGSEFQSRNHGEQTPDEHEDDVT